MRRNGLNDQGVCHHPVNAPFITAMWVAVNEAYIQKQIEPHADIKVSEGSIHPTAKVGGLS